jgi:hypothetical protein
MWTGLAAGAVVDAAVEPAPEDATLALTEPLAPVLVTVRVAGVLLDEHALTSRATAVVRPRTRRVDREEEGMCTLPR